MRTKNTMLFWIDGHNLIGALPDMDLADPRDEAHLLARLQTFAWRGGHRMVVFFDRGDGGNSPLPGTPSIEIRFAPRGLKADDLIRAALDSASRGTLQSVVVVTSDRALQEAARAAGVRAQRAHAFARQLKEVEREGTAPDRSETTTLSAEESDDLLRQFEARRQARARAAAQARSKKKEPRRKR